MPASPVPEFGNSGDSNPEDWERGPSRKLTGIGEAVFVAKATTRLDPSRKLGAFKPVRQGSRNPFAFQGGAWSKCNDERTDGQRVQA